MSKSGQQLNPEFWNDPNFNPYMGYIAGGFFTFVCVNYFTRYSVPDNLQIFKDKWKWCNTLTSFIHSTITGIWAPLSFYLDPKLGDDMITGVSKPAHILVCFSIGYFVYDFMDMFLYTWHKRSTKELLVHHTVVVTCFGIAAANKTYVAYAAISLIVEINSVFLHARQLLNICQVSKITTSYRLVALLNLVTYVFFRILLLGWMTRWLTLHRDDIPTVFFSVGSIGLASIFVINILNFYRILVSDFIKPQSEEVITASALDKALKTGADNGFHPVSKDVNRFVNSLFNPDAARDLDGAEMNGSSNGNSHFVKSMTQTSDNSKKFN